MKFQKAVRKASPMLLSLSGVSGSGKTYSSLKLAAGLAGPNGRVGFIDTENGRGSMYADSPGILADLPTGYAIGQLDPPYSPDRYIDCITTAEKDGISVLIIDSATHEWEGIGGCCEIAETNKLRGMPNWAKAKMLHKRFVNHCLSSNMHIVFCLRAREKVKIAKNADGREEVLPIGIQPIAEKNFVFEMTLSLQIDEHTHFASPIKVPEPLAHLFPGSKLLTREDGERIRCWNETGSALNPNEQLAKRSRVAAEQGMQVYKSFWSSLTPAQRKALAAEHEENKQTAEKADQVPTFGSEESPVEWPDSFDGAELIWNGKRYRFDESTGMYKPVESEVAA